MLNNYSHAQPQRPERVVTVPENTPTGTSVFTFNCEEFIDVVPDCERLTYSVTTESRVALESPDSLFYDDLGLSSIVLRRVYMGGPRRYIYRAGIAAGTYTPLKVRHYRFDLVFEITKVIESITVRDINDAMNGLPVISTGTLVNGLTLEVVDNDGTTLSDIKWSLTGGYADAYTVNSGGRLSIKSPQSLGFNIEDSLDIVAIVDNYQYVLEEMASTNVDISSSSLRVTLLLPETIIIKDGDVRDNTILETALPRTRLSNLALQVYKRGNLRVTENIVWSLIDSADGLFTIDSVTGDIALSSTGVLDYETDRYHSLTVYAEIPLQAGVGTELGRAIATASVNLDVLVLNQILEDEDPAPNIIREDADAGTSIPGVRFVLRDDNGDLISSEFYWVIVPGPAQGVFTIPLFGGNVALSPNVTLDYEVTPSYQVIVEAERAFDAKVFDVTLRVDVENVLESVSIQNLNRNPNALISTTMNTILEGIDLQAIDEGGRILTNVEHGLEWSFTDDNTLNNNNLFSINPESGEINWDSTDIAADRLPPGQQNFTITVTASALDRVKGRIPSTPLELVIEVPEPVVRIRPRILLENFHQ